MTVARARREVPRRILGVQPRLDGVPPPGNVLLREWQLLASSDADAGLHDVYPGDLLRHGVLDLHPRVHLQEKELVAGFASIGLLHQELDRADVVVADGLGGVDGRPPHRVAHLGGQGRARALLDELLVPALDRAVPLPQVDGVPVLVAQDLDLHVPGARQVALQVDGPVAEVRLTLPAGPLEGALGLRLVAGDGEALAPAPGGGLDRHRVAVLRGELPDGFGRIDRVLRAGRDRDAGPAHDPPRLHLAAHRLDRLGVRSDPGQTRLRDGPRERRALRQEPVSGVDGLGTAAPRRPRSGAPRSGSSRPPASAPDGRPRPRVGRAGLPGPRRSRPRRSPRPARAGRGRCGRRSRRGSQPGPSRTPRPCPPNWRMTTASPPSSIPAGTWCPRSPASRHRLRLSEDPSFGARSARTSRAATIAAASSMVGAGSTDVRTRRVMWRSTGSWVQ